ncbi:MULTISPECIES: ROK family protein [unclassified Mesorhizobium]|uniref:ROK family protein n=1 Tax=unclassified Mesorhizobium TaxID=325217 RepID=UPI0003CF7A3E|nr:MULTISPECIES: ROK family protein [unclassified Mesorhizobium]ESY55356.1 ROK family transcriptional regulator [Mesorhizobium sp. LNJC374B00]ESY57020.1 ROK family transcriptional regulator [Mesorhizobium sp. LNJC372A00]WJI83104.1 ROK family protein [Mesorhizobium sp. C374B]WJI89626.1 ROK family protein [Mesorhizobium sp. C372A]
MTRVLAIDLGGTNLRAAISTGDIGALETLGSEPAPATLDAFIVRINALCAEAGSVEAFGIAVPGLVEGPVCRWIPNLAFLDGVDIQTLFPKLRVALGNDAQIALLAEAVEGSAKNMSDAILLAIGTGIGSAVLANGRIVAGAHGGACSFGWACADVRDHGEERSGWLERVASGRALDGLAGQIGLADGRQLIAAAQAGELAALTLLELPARQLGTALAGAVALLDPQAVLISGGLAEALDVIRPPLLAALRRQLPPHLRGIEIKPGKFGPRAGLVGAALAGAVGQGWRQVR